MSPKPGAEDDAVGVVGDSVDEERDVGMGGMWALVALAEEHTARWIEGKTW